jgi:hypothetical protein
VAGTVQFKASSYFVPEGTSSVPHLRESNWRFVWRGWSKLRHGKRNGGFWC